MILRNLCLPVLLLAIAIVLVTVSSSTAWALWPTDPAVNLAITDRPGEEVVPKMAATSDGGCYIAWFDGPAGLYTVRMQRLDALGNEVWPHNGILVSDNPQSSSLVDWDLDCDRDDHAVLVFTDTRDGEDLDVFAYRIGPDGSFDWGPDGIQLSADAIFEPSPQCAALPDGDAVFAWPWLPDTGVGAILIQKVSPEGTVRFDPPVRIDGGGTNERPAFCDVVAAGSSQFIVGYVRDIRTFQSPRHLRAMKFAADGSKLGNGGVPLNVFEQTSLPIAYQPIVQSDEAGGAIFCWHYSDGNLYHSAVQRVVTGGTEIFPHNGVQLSLAPGVFHIEPTICFRPGEDEIIAFWQTRSSNQDRWGVSTQKITAVGNRAWTDNGRVLVPMDEIYEGQPRCTRMADGACVVYFDEPTGSQVQDRVMAMRVDANGSLVWGADPMPVSSIYSDKGRLPVVMRPDEKVIALWEDNRAGSIDLYAQLLNPDGTLGISAGSVPDVGAVPALAGSFPNPFHSTTQILLSGPAGSDLRLYDAQGRLVRTLASPGARVLWDGTDDRGAPVPGGVYLYRIDGGGETGRVVLVRR
ncbi:MAG: T9SS type A sorting domain-containing protein [Candidatus Eisenbacteria bacterium]|nr:T9SS type A sorting domain-containing protein [Candidatus Eisenbacteria bacterium]